MKKSFQAFLVCTCALTLSGCFGSKRSVSDYLAKAQEYQSQGNAPKAQVELRSAVAAYPNDPQANLALAKIEDGAGDLAAAVPHYVRAASPEARLIEPQLRVIEILLESNRFAEAYGRVNATIGSFPRSADAIAFRADIAERQGQLVAARTDDEAALAIDPTNARALAVSAMLDLRVNDGAGAISIVDRGLKRHPNDLRLLQVRAAALLTLNQPDKAVEALRSITRAAPRNVAIQTALAQVDAASGHQEDAIANFRAAVDADPSNRDMQLAFIRFLAAQNQESDVIAFMKKRIADNPTTGTYDLIFAEYLRENNQIAEAGRILDAAAARLKQGPDYLSIQLARAKRDGLEGRAGEAFQATNAVLAADPQNEAALLYLATLEQDHGRTQAAITDLLKVTRVNPVNAQAFQLLAACYLAENDPRKAVEAMQRAVFVVPQDVGAQVGLASFMQRAGQVDASRELLARLTLQSPDNKNVWAASAQLAIDRKDWATAKSSLSRLRQIPGTDFEVVTLSGRMKAAQGDAAGAAKDFQTAITSDPAVEPSILGLYARASVAAGQTAQAADFLEQSAAKFKGDALEQAWAAVMTLRADAGQFDKADTAFQNARRAAPRDASLYKGYVNILLAQKKFDRAAQTVAEGLQSGVSHTDMLLLSGTVNEVRGNIAGAMKDYHDALAGNPLSLPANNNYASLLADQDPRNLNALGKARDALDGAEATGNPSVIDTMAWLDYRLGRFDEAKQLLQRINAGQSPSPQLRFHLAAVLIATGDRPSGMALLDSVKGLDFPGNDEARSLSAT